MVILGAGVAGGPIVLALACSVVLVSDPPLNLCGESVNECLDEWRERNQRSIPR